MPPRTVKAKRIPQQIRIRLEQHLQQRILKRALAIARTACTTRTPASTKSESTSATSKSSEPGKMRKIFCQTGRAAAQQQWSMVREAVGRARQRAHAHGARRRRCSTAWRAAFSLEQAAMQAAAKARRQAKATVAPRRAGPARLHRVSAIGSTLHQQLDARLPTAFGDG